MFWSEIGSGFGEPGGTTPPQIPRSPPPPPGIESSPAVLLNSSICFSVFCKTKFGNFLEF